MDGWTASLLAYLGLWLLLCWLAWYVGRVPVGDRPAGRELCHQPSELFLAMSDEVLLLDHSDERASECVLRETSRMDLDPLEARNILD